MKPRRSTLFVGSCLEMLRSVPFHSCVDLVVTKAKGSQIDVWRECLRLLKPGAFAFIVGSSRQDKVAALAQELEEAGFVIGFSPLVWVYKIRSELEVRVVLVAMKPLDQKTYLDQALANGKGCTWLDDVRIPTTVERPMRVPTGRSGNVYGSLEGSKAISNTLQGRFPANLLVSRDALNSGKVHSSCQSKKHHSAYNGDSTTGFLRGNSHAGNQYSDSGSFSRFFDLDAWWAAHGDSSLKGGGAPLASYLITLGSRPGDLVLDPFAGRGAVRAASLGIGRRFVGVVRDDHAARVVKERVGPALRVRHHDNRLF